MSSYSFSVSDFPSAHLSLRHKNPECRHTNRANLLEEMNRTVFPNTLRCVIDTADDFPIGSVNSAQYLRRRDNVIPSARTISGLGPHMVQVKEYFQRCMLMKPNQALTKVPGET